MAALKRIQKDFQEFENTPPALCTGGPDDEDDMFKWTITMEGPEGSPYEGGNFVFKIEFPQDYPFKPPKVHVDTKVFHPSINDQGHICMNELKDQWSPKLSLCKLLTLISSMFSEPDPDSQLVPDVAKLLKEDPEKFKATAKEWTEKYAS